MIGSEMGEDWSVTSLIVDNIFDALVIPPFIISVLHL